MTSIALLVVAATVAFVFFLSSLEGRWVKGFLNWVPAILFADIFPAIFTHESGLDLSVGPIHDWSKDLVIPLALLMVMSFLSLSQLRLIGFRPIAVFASGSAAFALAPAFRNSRLFMLLVS